MAAYHTVQGGITVFFPEEEQIVISGFRISRYIISVDQFIDHSTDIY